LLRVDLDRRFSTPPSKAELDAAEWVKIEILSSREKTSSSLFRISCLFQISYLLQIFGLLQIFSLSHFFVQNL